MDALTLEVKFATGEAGTFTGYASVFGGEPDSYGDVIAPGAFAASLAEHKAGNTRPLLLWQHDQSEPVGVWESVEEDAHGLKVSGRLVLDTARGRDAYALLKAGALNGLSIGYRVRDYERRGRGRLLKHIELIEISIVSVPAASPARITSVKSDATAAMGAAHSKKDHAMSEQTKAAPEDMGDGNTVESRVGTLEEKVSGMDTRLQKVEESVGNVAKSADRIEAKLNRPGAVETKAANGTSAEVKAFNIFVRQGPEALGAEVKALTRGTDNAGGYLAPDEYRKELDKNLVLYSPMRQIARISTTSSAKVFLPSRTANLTASWVAETANRSSTQPTYGQTALDVFEMGCYVDISNQLLEDADFNMAQELAADFGEEFGRLEGAAFVDGSGTGEPEGFLTNADITGKTAAAADAITADELIDLFHTLPTVYAANGTWVMNRTTLGVLRKLKDSAGQYIAITSPINGQPATTILGRPVVEMPDMPDLGASAKPIAFGDFKAGFRIFDRVGLSILRDPYSVQTSGQVRFHARRRVGGAVTKAEAIKTLTMAAA